MNHHARLKLSFGMIVLNGEPFIRYNLENLYPHAHEILIVEGAVEKFAHAATPDGHSIDNTVEIIKSFPDPDNKIKLIQRHGFWPEKDEMSNAYMAACTGDYIWQVDVDEFYKPEDIEKVRALLMEEPEISRVDIKTINFWRGFTAVLQGATYIYGYDEFIRIFRFRPGYRYLTHRPPTLLDETGQEFVHTRVVSASELIDRCGVYLYHYSYVFPEYVRGKAAYYASMNWGGGHQDGLAWYRSNWVTITNPLRMHIISFPPSWIVPFAGKHPQIIESLRRDISHEEDPELVGFLRQEYLRYKDAGENLARLILERGRQRSSRLKVVAVCLGQLFLPVSLKAMKADFSILRTTMRLICS